MALARQQTSDFKGDHLSVNMMGLVADATPLVDGAITAGTVAFSSASATFTAADIGKTICVTGAGAAGAALLTTISAVVDAHSVTLATGASTTVSSAKFVYGTDNGSNLALATAAFVKSKRKVVIPAGWYLTTQTWDISGISIEVEGHGKDNTASSVIVYCGTGVGCYVHPVDLSVQTFAVNMRYLAFITYGGASDGLKLRNLSQGVFEHISINDDSVGSATRGLNLVNPNILSFEGLIVTRSTGAAITIESTGFPFDATNIAFTGGNLYQNATVFDLRAALNHLTIRDFHVEQFTHLVTVDRSLGAANLQINRLVIEHCEILGSTNSYNSDLLNITVTGIQTLAAFNVVYKHCYIYFGTAKLNPFLFTVDGTATLTFNLSLRDNAFSGIDTSLISAVLNPANSLLTVFAENNQKVFGSAFTILSAGSTGVTLNAPVYGGDGLTTVDAVPHVLSSGILTDSPKLKYYGSDNTHKTLETLSDNVTDGQLRIGDSAASRVMKVTVPTAAYTALLSFLGALSSLGINGLLAVGTDEQPTITLFLHDKISNHTQLQIKAGSSDGAGDALLNVLTGAGAAVLQVTADGSLYLLPLTASRPLKVDSAKKVVAGKIDVGVANDIAATGFSNGDFAKWDSGAATFVAGAAGTTLPVVDTTAVVKGSSDASKLVRFEADGLTTGTTRVATMPDRDITLNQMQNLNGDASADLTCTTSYADITGATITLTLTGTYLIICDANIAVNQPANQVTVQLVIGGTAQTPILELLINTSTSTDSIAGSVSRSFLYSNSGSNVAKLQGKKTINAGTGQVKQPGTTIKAAFLG